MAPKINVQKMSCGCRQNITEIVWDPNKKRPCVRVTNLNQISVAFMPIFITYMMNESK